MFSSGNLDKLRKDGHRKGEGGKKQNNNNLESITLILKKPSYFK